ncbi:hypothetical protein B0X29_07185 [Helicobacter pylori]|nr:hypothetical protein B0X29_07185 [Helicobacter pylori]
MSANNRSKTAYLLANASLGGFVVSKPRLHALLGAKRVGLAKWLATRKGKKFFLKSVRLFGFFSCFLLSKIAYNQFKTKKTMNYLPKS